MCMDDVCLEQWNDVGFKKLNFIRICLRMSTGSPAQNLKTFI